jgi:hypothetical protein
MRPLNLSFLVLAAAACNPYTQRDGEFIAGSVDPANFPVAYLGSGGDRTKAGSGSFTATQAFVDHTPVGYYLFSFSSKEIPPPPPPPAIPMPPPNPLPPAQNPLRLIVSGAPDPSVPTPTAYAFDPQNPCVPPSGYTYDPRNDDVHYDQQGAIFTALPAATFPAGKAETSTYVPVVSEALVEAPGLGCQAIKSAETLTSGQGVAAPSSLSSMPSGRYLAWAIIDVAAPVYRLGETKSNSNGWGPQKLGWYNHYITAYLDGGYIPTDTTTGDDGKTNIFMHPQKLYYPVNDVLIYDPLKKKTTQFRGGYGYGYDVIEAKRGDANYSPVCQMFTYDTGAVTNIDGLPKSIAEIKALFSATIKPASTPYIFCLQVP